MFISSYVHAFFLLLGLPELKEHLLARSPHVDDIEQLKKEFSQQKLEIKELNETELENLRRYEKPEVVAWAPTQSLDTLFVRF